MKYIIHELVQPEHLKGVKGGGYNIHTVERSVLERLDLSNVEEEHPTLESALSEIADKKELLKHLTLTVIPIISIRWDGEIT